MKLKKAEILLSCFSILSLDFLETSIGKGAELFSLCDRKKKKKKKHLLFIVL